jgi:hypothetical protein
VIIFKEECENGLDLMWVNYAAISNEFDVSDELESEQHEEL